MNISKELKARLFKASSEEEVKALLGDQASAEEASKAWEELQKYRARQEKLDAVDDDELEAVAGGALWCLFGGEYAADGREVNCFMSDYSDWDQVNDEICPKGNEAKGWYHDWKIIRRSADIFNTLVDIKCTKCSEERKDVPADQWG